jgi:hypothetical protein
MKNTTNVTRAALLAISFCLFFFAGNAQTIQEVQNSFNLYKQSALQEKIFVHIDKTVYLPGEILWFKVYCLDGNDNKLLNLSKVVYIDILDNNQNPITQSKVEMKNGLGDGSIYIPVTVTNGNYKFRAYTSWMKNFSPEFYFEKNLTFINPLKIPEGHKDNTDRLDVQFFPEGGNLVSGIESKVAFKATGTNGKGVNIKGAIVDQHNDTITKFQSLKFGMGNFSFTPVTNNIYKAIIYENGNPAVTKDLPAINTQGYVMKITDNGSGQIIVNVKVAGYPDGNIYLFAHTRQTITAAETGVCVNGTTNFSINRGSLGEGISHLTVFNSNKQPVCERLYFKRPASNLMISAAADQQQYGLRKKINVNLAAKNADGKPLNAEMSMAVYRIDSLQEADPVNIFNYLWLSSDLKGFIESPSYYFKNDDKETKEAQDNLMLTQGWSRFQWDQVLQNKPAMFSYLPEYSGHVITAKIFNTETNAPAKNIITYLGIPGKRVQLYSAQSDSAGHLTYFTKDFFGPNEIIAETNSNIDSTYRIDLSSPFAEQYSKTPTPRFDIYPALITPLKEHSLGVQVLNIYSGNQIKRFDYPIVDSSAFYGKPFKTYKLDDFTRFTTMEEDLREYVSEDNIINSRGKFHIKVLNERGFLDSDPLVLIDGIPIFNIDKLFNIDPLKVRKLEVVPFRYFYGPSDEEGIFSFTTYKGDLGGVDLDAKAVVMDYEGLQLHRQFYSPVYASDAESSSRMPDFRNLLYWTPSVSGNGPISFYSSDQAGKYIGVVQGITNNGDAGSEYFTFDVK